MYYKFFLSVSFVFSFLNKIEATSETCTVNVGFNDKLDGDVQGMSVHERGFPIKDQI